jgi:hypothetical protein
MAEHAFQTFPQSDQQLIEALQKIASELGVLDSAEIKVDITDKHSIPLAAKDANQSPKLKPMLEQNEPLAFRCTLHKMPHWNVTVTRQLTGSDKIAVFLGDQMDPTEAARIVSSIHVVFPTYGRTEALDRLLGDELAEFYRKREEGLTRLEGLSQKLVEQNEAYRRKLDTEHTEIRSKAREQLEVDQARLQKDYEGRSDQLRQREEALAERVKELDDRESTHVRRELRREFKKQLAEREVSFGLTNMTIKKRWLIHGLFALLIVVSLAVLGHAMWTGLVRPDGTPNWIPVIRASVSALAFIASIVFYIRWSDDWFRQHADEEFRLKRLQLDIDRASWVVETALDWRRDHEAGVIPKEIIEGMTRNLFVDPLRSAPKHPSEDLASVLFGASSGFVLKTPSGSELRLDRKGIRRVEEAVKRAEGE